MTIRQMYLTKSAIFEGVNVQDIHDGDVQIEDSVWPQNRASHLTIISPGFGQHFWNYPLNT